MKYSFANEGLKCVKPDRVHADRAALWSRICGSLGGATEPQSGLDQSGGSSSRVWREPHSLVCLPGAENHESQNLLLPSSPSLCCCAIYVFFDMWLLTLYMQRFIYKDHQSFCVKTCWILCTVGHAVWFSQRSSLRLCTWTLFAHGTDTFCHFLMLRMRRNSLTRRWFCYIH